VPSHFFGSLRDVPGPQSAPKHYQLLSALVSESEVQALLSPHVRRCSKLQLATHTAQPLRSDNERHLRLCVCQVLIRPGH
jgi:hypothetical protein